MTRSPATYDRVVPIYDFSKTLLFLGSIQRCQNHYLPLLKESKTLLIIGGGTGKIIDDIQKHCNFEALDYVDNSPKMIASAEQHIQKQHPQMKEKIKFHALDVFNYSPASMHDAIIVPFALDCFTNEQLNNLGDKLTEWLASDGLLLFSDFHESKSSGSSRLLSRLITRTLYFILNTICRLRIDELPDFERMFKNQPWVLLGEHTFFFGVLKSYAYKRF